MKIETCYWVEGYNVMNYDLQEEDLREYVNWCLEEDLEVDNEYNLIEFLESGINSEDDFNVKNSSLEHVSGTRMVLDKCLEIENEYK